MKFNRTDALRNQALSVSDRWWDVFLAVLPTMTATSVNGPEADVEAAMSYADLVAQEMLDAKTTDASAP